MFSLYIFYTQEEFRKISTGLLYLLMTLFNTIHLYVLVIEFLRLYNINIYQGTIFNCGFNSFIQNVTRAMSTYLAVAVAIDRLIRSELPVQSRYICTRRNAVILTIVYVIIFIAMWSSYLYQMNFYNAIVGRCINQPASLSYYNRYIHDIARTVIVCIIPIVFITAANLRLTFNIRASRRRVHGTDRIMRDTQTMYTNALTAPGQGTNTVRQATSFDRMNLYMMVANVTALFVTQIPFHVDQIRSNFMTLSDPIASRLLRPMFLIWSSLYFGIGFYGYCLSAPLFRRKCLTMLKNLIPCRRNAAAT